MQMNLNQGPRLTQLLWRRFQLCSNGVDLPVYYSLAAKRLMIAYSCETSVQVGLESASSYRTSLHSVAL